MNIYQARRANLATWMAQNSIALAVFEDSEHHRDPAIRYFTGHPSDAVLGIRIDGESLLAAWDFRMAKRMADAGKIMYYSTFDCSPVRAAEGLTRFLKIPEGSRVEIPATTPYPQFLRYVDSLNKFDVLCRENGVSSHVNKLRSIKDEYELAHLREACAVTNKLIDGIEAAVKNGNFKTESDIALYIEKEARKAGCEGTSFSTLAAGSARSFGIHCFPNYTDGVFADTGLSILDFGVTKNGYGSDVTLTFARQPLSEKQEEMLSLIETAYTEALKLYKPGLSTREAAKKAHEIFWKSKYTMPHSLGHGVGLQAHEDPAIKDKEDADQIFESGMVVTLEPGLYNNDEGGCRFENTILITDEGNEVLTKSRIIRL